MYNSLCFTVKFKYSGTDNPEVVYFDIDSWDASITNVVFDVKPGTYVVVNCPDKSATIGTTTGINQVYVEYAGNDISQMNNGGQNNNPESAYILYNFPNASRVNFFACFNGTILAPNALFYSYDENNKGKSGDQQRNPHLSGAVIAKSFEGGAEIGFRPYLGPASIVGVEEGYELSFDKLNEDGSEKIDGAQIGAYPVDDEGNVSLFPEYVGESGNGDKIELPAGKYVIKEYKAPTGFQIDTKNEYYIEIKPGEARELNINQDPTITYTRKMYTLTNDDAAAASDPLLITEADLADGNYELISHNPIGFNVLAWSSHTTTVEMKDITFFFKDGTSVTTSDITPNHATLETNFWDPMSFGGLGDKQMSDVVGFTMNFEGEGESKIVYQYPQVDLTPIKAGSYSYGFTERQYYKKAAAGEDQDSEGYAANKIIKSNDITIGYVDDVEVVLYDDAEFKSVVEWK